MLLPMTKLLIMSSVCLFIKKFTHFFWRKYHLFLTFHIMPEKQKEKINLIAFINDVHLVNIIFVLIVLVAKNHHLLFVIVKEKVDERR